ncbi:MAG: hypothetical protein UU98_C0001G0009 [Parcubacteria group bacterium GW2011_GWD2_42_14]|nr:MAG: hypothetical protein UU98_C0001G0009 [Parcubacteria group bacterium GW2011_GWD2_42_14]
MSQKVAQFRRPRIVTIGGGTGHFALLSGLKNCKVDLTAVVTMADDGGSTGVLRDELGVLPPGDLRQCLVALSEADELVRELFTHRFAKGSLKGHSFGNLFISALEQVSGSIERAVEGAADVLKIHGEVLPVTLDKTKLIMTLADGTKLAGEHAVSASKNIRAVGIKSMRLAPKAELNPKVERAIRQADLIVLGPGNLYSSLIPNLLVPGLPEALRRAHAPTVFIMNLMNKEGHSDDFSCGQYLDEVEKHAGGSFVDFVLYNTGVLPDRLVKRYEKEGKPVKCKPPKKSMTPHFVGANVISTSVPKKRKGDPLERTLIRHDGDKLARAIMKILEETSNNF